MGEGNSSVREVNTDEMSSRYELPVPPGRIDRLIIHQPPRRNSEQIEAIKEMGEELRAGFDSALKDLAATITNARPVTAPPPAPVTRQLEPTSLEACVLTQVPPFAWDILKQCMCEAIHNDVSVADPLARALESGRVKIRWALTTSPGRRSDGSTTLHEDGTITMILNLGAHDLRKVCHHETFHLLDFIRHGRRLSTRELEERAVAYTARMLAPPPQPKRPAQPEPEPEPSGYHALNGRRRWYS